MQTKNRKTFKKKRTRNGRPSPFWWPRRRMKEIQKKKKIRFRFIDVSVATPEPATLKHFYFFLHFLRILLDANRTQKATRKRCNNNNNNNNNNNHHHHNNNNNHYNTDSGVQTNGRPTKPNQTRRERERERERESPGNRLPSLMPQHGVIQFSVQRIA